MSSKDELSSHYSNGTLSQEIQGGLVLLPHAEQVGLVQIFITETDVC